MNNTLTWQLALRYLRGKRSGNAVPILSRISMTAIAVGSGAMIVILSVFNGFDGLVQSLYKAFYPDIKISAARGKFFTLADGQLASLKKVHGVQDMSLSIEDNVLIISDKEQKVVMLKGVDKSYFKVNDVGEYIVQGRDSVSELHKTAILGLQIANTIGADVDNVFSLVHVYYPDLTGPNALLDAGASYRSLQLRPDGAFKVQEEFDGKYMLAALAPVQELFGMGRKYSAIEVRLAANADPEKVKQQFMAVLGSGYKAETRFEQNRTTYMVMRIEKWATYAILLLVLIIASFNMVGALSSLVLEKQKDIAILRAMGAQPSSIRGIFLLEGVLWAFTGGLAGMALAIAICLAQQHFKLVKMEGSFVIDAYPVTMQWQDMALVLTTILAVGFLAALFPAYRAARTSAPALKSA